MVDRCRSMTPLMADKLLPRPPNPIELGVVGFVQPIADSLRRVFFRRRNVVLTLTNPSSRRAPLSLRSVRRSAPVAGNSLPERWGCTQNLYEKLDAEIPSTTQMQETFYDPVAQHALVTVPPLMFMNHYRPLPKSFQRSAAVQITARGKQL